MLNVIESTMRYPLFSFGFVKGQAQAWQDEVERARQSQRDAESKLSSLEVNISCFKNSKIYVNFCL